MDFNARAFRYKDDLVFRIDEFSEMMTEPKSSGSNTESNLGDQVEPPSPPLQAEIVETTDDKPLFKPSLSQSSAAPSPPPATAVPIEPEPEAPHPTQTAQLAEFFYNTGPNVDQFAHDFQPLDTIEPEGSEDSSLSVDEAKTQVRDDTDAFPFEPFNPFTFSQPMPDITHMRSADPPADHLDRDESLNDIVNSMFSDTSQRIPWTQRTHPNPGTCVRSRTNRRPNTYPM